jgi:hypothetical protein
LDNLAAAGAGKAAAAGSGGPGPAPSDAAEEVEEEDVEVPEALEEIIDQLVTGLRDRDTVVRWSAAKGVGRITGRLPKEFADDVVAAVLQLLRPEEGDGAWHGGYAAVAPHPRRPPPPLPFPAFLSPFPPVPPSPLPSHACGTGPLCP